jgi:hypothetical protein
MANALRFAYYTCALSPARGLGVVKELTCRLGVACGLRVAMGLGEDTGVAETGNKLGEAAVFPNPTDLLANYERKRI